MHIHKGGPKPILHDQCCSIYLFIKYQIPIKIAMVKKPMEMKWL